MERSQDSQEWLEELNLRTERAVNASPTGATRARGDSHKIYSLEHFLPHRHIPEKLNSPRSLRVCQEHGIDPDCLIPQPLEVFESTDQTEEEHWLRYLHAEELRQERLQLLMHHRSQAELPQHQPLGSPTVRGAARAHSARARGLVREKMQLVKESITRTELRSRARAAKEERAFQRVLANKQRSEAAVEAANQLQLQVQQRGRQRTLARARLKLEQELLEKTRAAASESAWACEQRRREQEEARAAGERRRQTTSEVEAQREREHEEQIEKDMWMDAQHSARVHRHADAHLKRHNFYPAQQQRVRRCRPSSDAVDWRARSARARQHKDSTEQLAREKHASKLLSKERAASQRLASSESQRACKVLQNQSCKQKKHAQLEAALRVQEEVRRCCWQSKALSEAQVTASLLEEQQREQSLRNLQKGLVAGERKERLECMQRCLEFRNTALTHQLNAKGDRARALVEGRESRSKEVRAAEVVASLERASLSCDHNTRQLDYLQHRQAHWNNAYLRNAKGKAPDDLNEEGARTVNRVQDMEESALEQCEVSEQWDHDLW
eukprot:CAMPEP_0114229590 /NCGR_PEP_ID=MMETSP0058-20121206/2998_1 /TAXON_ID=36894 /ORGANISM="Pyramimonas parkeae, CCMP726" /LENGTH=554 /DNA_ID=CAMNT_0001340695 /DNA_START=228 /DNA_END=1889 /DNA_ORIENTATION=+